MFDQLKDLAGGLLDGFGLDDVLKMFPSDFISKNSPFASFNELLEKFGFNFGKDGLDVLKSDTFSSFLQSNSTFSSLTDMISKLGK